MHATLANGNGPSRRDESCMLQGVRGDKLCGWDVDCPQRYSIKELQVPAKVSEAERKEQHQKAQFECANSAVGHTTPTGGWCYHTVNQTLISKDKQAVDKDYFLPLDHCAFDEGLAKAISKLFLKDGESVTDLGAGVGQAGHALRALLPKLDYRGYDGAGNVEEYTGGSVKFADLTLPMAVEVSAWVMSVEVGEHIPHAFEKDLIRNIHL